MKPYFQSQGIIDITIYHGDCREILPTLSDVDLILTDPPYLTSDSKVPIRGAGVAEVIEDTNSVGLPWGYSLDWIELCPQTQHWVVFANYRMLGGLCSRLEPTTVFIWHKSNAPRMTRPVPRLDCEFIIWSRSPGASCEDMGKFQSMIVDVPMPQAGCFPSERILVPGSKKAAHPCQKPMAVVQPFIDRLHPRSVLDPFMGTGTTAVAAKLAGCSFVGIEIEERYCEITANRLRNPVLFT